jgi:hypothetical protein
LVPRPITVQPKVARSNRAVVSDLNVVFHDDNPDLGNLDPPLASPGIAESITADHHAGVQNDAVADPAAIADHHVGMKHAVFPDLTPYTEKNSRVNYRASADLRTAAYIGMRKYGDRRANFARRVDMGERADRFAEMRRDLEKLKYLRKCQVWIGANEVADSNPWPQLRRDLRADNNRARATTRQVSAIARMGQERDRPRPRLVNGSYPFDNDLVIADDRSPTYWASSAKSCSPQLLRLASAIEN